jgi:hypothetical protein
MELLPGKRYSVVRLEIGLAPEGSTVTAHTLRTLLAELCELAHLNPSDVVDSGELEIDGFPVTVTSAPDDDHVMIAVSLGTPPDADLRRTLPRQLLMREFEHLGEAVALHFSMRPDTDEIVASLTLPCGELGTAAELMELIELAIDEANDELEDAAALVLAEEMQAAENAELDDDALEM